MLGYLLLRYLIHKSMMLTLPYQKKKEMYFLKTFFLSCYSLFIVANFYLFMWYDWKNKNCSSLKTRLLLKYYLQNLEKFKRYLRCIIISMTSLLMHTVAHSTRPSYRPKIDNQPLKKSLAVSWVKVVKNGKTLTFKVNFLRQKLSESFSSFFFFHRRISI